MDLDDDIKAMEKAFGCAIERLEDTEMSDWEKKKKEVSLLKFHVNKKYILGPRLWVLRAFVKKAFKKKVDEMVRNEFNARCEKYVDNLLVRNEYNLEKCIELVKNKLTE